MQSFGGPSSGKRKEASKFKGYMMWKTQILAFIHITTPSVNDMNAMVVIPYEQEAYYIFDRGYNDFRRLFIIHTVEAFFVLR